jgi:hypothetical protein
MSSTSPAASTATPEGPLRRAAEPMPSDDPEAPACPISVVTTPDATEMRRMTSAPMSACIMASVIQRRPNTRSAAACAPTHDKCNASDRIRCNCIRRPKNRSGSHAIRVSKHPCSSSKGVYNPSGHAESTDQPGSCVSLHKHYVLQVNTETLRRQRIGSKQKLFLLTTKPQRPAASKATPTG